MKTQLSTPVIVAAVVVVLLIVGVIYVVAVRAGGPGGPQAPEIVNDPYASQYSQPVGAAADPEGIPPASGERY